MKTKNLIIALAFMPFILFAGSKQNKPVVHEADVIVCGGGPAGIVAAISSARNGAKGIYLIRVSSNGFPTKTLKLIVK